MDADYEVVVEKEVVEKVKLIITGSELVKKLEEMALRYLSTLTKGNEEIVGVDICEIKIMGNGKWLNPIGGTTEGPFEISAHVKKNKR